MPAGDKTSIRVTADVFQQSSTPADAFYRGWVVRLKYAYLQYDYLKSTDLTGVARVGIVHTVMIEQEEQFWPRWLGTVGAERNGFFSSADMGAATQLTLPNKRGEVYAVVSNGPGYTSRETDRFKDFAARLTLSPFANGSGYLKGLQISPWFSIGARASDYARKRGTTGPIPDAREKNRYGLLVQVRDPRLTLGAHLARRSDVAEAADTTTATTPTTTDFSGDVFSIHALVKPLLYVQSAPEWPLGLVFRFDRFKPNTDRDAYQQNLIAGLSWDFNRRTSVYFDVQALRPKSGSTATDTRTWFLHVIANY
jgi:hypothetical protein